MPAILVVSKMKSALPKPMHSAVPIPHVPTRAVCPQPCARTPSRPATCTPPHVSSLKRPQAGNLKRPQASTARLPPSSPELPLQERRDEGELGDSAPAKLSQPADSLLDSQIYTDWANHYLAKSGHKRLIKDLQEDVADGVLLAEIIQVVANEKIEDINGCPKSCSQMIENIDTCLAFLAAKGVNIQGLSAEEIRNGNLKAILGLFFSLSRYKQQQQTQRQSSQQLHTPHTHSHTALSQQSSAPAHLSLPSHGTPSPSATHTHRAQAEMQSRGASESKLLKFSIGQKKSSRLPGPTSRVSAAGSEGSPRGSISSAGNRRSQAFSDKAKPAAAQAKESSDSISSQLPGMTEHAPSCAAAVSTSTVITSSVASSSQCSAIPQPSSSGKPWRSKSLSTKHTSTSTILSVKQEAPAKQPAPADPPPKTLPQRSMLEKLKLFNSKGGSKSSAQAEGAVGKEPGVVLERVEAGSNTEPLEEAEGNARPVPSSGAVSLSSSSPKMALKGIAQRTFSRALTAKKGSTKNVEKEKEKERERSKEKERGKEGSKRLPASEKAEIREELAEEMTGGSEVGVAEAEPKRTSKIASLIPKGGKVGAKKDSSAPVHTGIPKPGSKNTGTGAGKSSGAPISGKDNERPRSMRLGGGAGLHRDSRHSSSSSSLASTEGKAHQHHTAAPVGNGGTTQSTASNTVSVQLPQPQQQYSHPNTATVAPFMYRSQTEGDDGVTSETVSGGSFNKTNQTSIEDLSGEDPETRRLRTVKNIADLRQNLEETMSSLRGTQITHSTLETTFDGGVTTEANSRSLLSLSSRPAPLSWTTRVGQSSPRLQAGDAPSLGNSYQSRGGGSAAGPGRYLYAAPLRRQLAGRGSALCGLELGERGEELELDVSGYVSDGDVLAKNARADDLSSGYMTDGGLSLYTRRLNRLPDGMAVVRETLQRNASSGQGDADSWDDSSSVSSGISDMIDTDDINTSSSISSYTNTPATSRKALSGQPQTDAEKHSAVERTSNWSGDDVKRSDGGSDSGVRMEASSKWRKNPSDISDESDKGGSTRKATAISHTGSWRKGMTAQVGVTAPRTKGATVSTGTGTLKTHGTAKTDDAKVSEKGCFSTNPSGVHHSPSDAGRSNSDSTPTRMPTCTFGFKKPNSGSGSVTIAATSSVSMVTASGATITSGSATLGKIPKSSALMVGGGRGGLKGAPEGSPVPQEDSYLVASARSTLQYRSLPRPSRSGAAARNGNRSSTSSIESGLSTRATTLTVTANKMPTQKTNGSNGSPANQTDKEKGGASEMDNLRGCVFGSGGGAATIPQTARQGSKYTEVSSPTLRRLFGGKAPKQPPVTTAESLKNSVVISNPHATLGHHTLPAGSLDSPSAGGPGSGGSSPLYGGRGAGPVGSEQASSPGSVYSTGTGTWGTTASSSSAPGYPSVSSMHTSSESIDMSLGSGHHRDDNHPPLTRAASAKTESPLSSPSASPKFNRNTLPRKQDSDSYSDRNTLPKKGFRYCPSPQVRQEEARDWLRSHSAGGLQDSASNSPFSTGSSLTSPSGTRFNFAQLASPTTAAQINLASLRNNSVSNQDSMVDSSGDTRLRNSCMSLDEKTRTMSRSASFRDGFEEAHGSSLSLVSSTSSIYSTTEEKSQSEIRKLRRELDASQEKVSALTTQLSANAHLVAAFEQSLANMTIRLKSLTMTAEQKDSELTELRKTIELLKRQNAVAQAAINGVINTPELVCKSERTGSNSSAASGQTDLRMRRQHSSDSVSSVTSATSHSSMGSTMDNSDNCSKKKKKNWLRSSFKQAFTKKKSPKSASSHSDIEEMTDSLPSSPKLSHNGSSTSSALLRNSHSNSLWCELQGSCPDVGVRLSVHRLPECLDGEAEMVMQLRTELREKEMKLTDIRLEALSSAHQLDQLREAMNRMQVEIEKLKAENDRLKLETQAGGGRVLPQSSSVAASVPSTAMLSPGLSQHSLDLTESTGFNILLDDSGGDSSFRKEGRHVKIVVRLQEDAPWREDCRPRDFLIGCIGVSGKTKWDVLDGVVRRLFKEYIRHVDPVSQLGLGSDSVEGYRIGDVLRPSGADTPELLPCGYLVGENNTIHISLKGVHTQSTDALVFDTLIPQPVLQRYVSLLREHRRLILSGPSGTGKTYLAQRLAEHLVLLEGRTASHTAVVTFSVDHKSSKELRQYLAAVGEQWSAPGQDTEAPLVLILDNLHHVGSLGEIFNGLLNYKYQRCPYIIGTMSQATSSSPNLQLHHNFRWVLCANHMEPVKGFLGRFLRRKLMETEISSRSRSPQLVKIMEWIPRVWQHLNRFLEAHSSSDVTIGPRLFLSCPMDVDGSRVWFTDLWNYSIIPYLLEAVREGLQLYGRRAPWDDPARWVLETFPWGSSPQHPDWPPLLQLRPEDVGFDGYSASREGASKQSTQSDSDADPLMNMLMRLKEAASCSSPQSYDSDSNSNGHQDDILDSSLESTL
ncbi:neuron navigator 2 isoform X1 [Electrophorus electricus]|uniref:neuron navigator 2 isoform X1 n=1 Tax=Electrophorus electricus TaxID=8005 RepID=UPI0015CFA5CE|nr:neuron navigator 2 isoform X1 [Electrophorus electricus]